MQAKERADEDLKLFLEFGRNYSQGNFQGELDYHVPFSSVSTSAEISVDGDFNIDIQEWLDDSEIFKDIGKEFRLFEERIEEKIYNLSEDFETDFRDKLVRFRESFENSNFNLVLEPLNERTFKYSITDEQYDPLLEEEINYEQLADLLFRINYYGSKKMVEIH